MAVLKVAEAEGIEGELKELAKALDEVANMTLYLGAGGDLNRCLAGATTLARGMMDKYFANTRLAEEALDQVRELIRISALKLRDLYERSGEMVESGRIEELQNQASELARPLARVCWYNIDPIGAGVRSELKEVARKLHLTETMRIYMDGGASMRAVVDRIKESVDALAELSERTSA